MIVIPERVKEITHMAAETRVPSPARDLTRIHHVITRGLGTGIEQGSQFQQNGFPQGNLMQGFCDYCRSLAVVLSSHHQTEDALIFPAFQEKLPQAPYEHLATQHRQIETLLEKIYAAVDELSLTTPNGLETLLEGLQQISVIWAPHIRMEESIFSHEAICEVMSAAEQADLAARVGKFSQEHSVPPDQIVPFVLFNCAGEDRAAFLANMPPTLMEELVLGAWRDRWDAMKPFLLE